MASKRNGRKNTKTNGTGVRGEFLDNRRRTKVGRRKMTERPRSRRELQNDEERFRRYFDLGLIGMAITTPSQGWLEVNDQLCQILGYDRSELLQKTWAELTHPDDLAADVAEFNRVLAGEIEGYSMEKRWIRKDGQIIHTTISVKCFRRTDGSVDYFVGLMQDVTERKRAEEALRESEERYRSLFASAPMAVFVCDQNAVIQYYNQRAVELWGREPVCGLERHCGSVKLWRADGTLLPHAESPVVEVLRTGVPALNVEVFIERPDGSRLPVLANFATLRDARGNISGAITSFVDITADKERAETLRGSEERFRLMVEGAKEYAMFLLNPSNRITFWSGGAERVFGWTQKEAVGQSGEMIFTPEDRAKRAVEKEINVARIEGRAADRRFHLRKDGSRFWTDGVLMRLNDERGNLRGFAKVARDATDQRRVEDELRHARDEMEQRVVERTRDLLATNNELERTMSERQQLEKELLEISEREKRRIGQDLHDIVCQELSAAALYLKSSANKAEGKNPAAAKTLNQAAHIVNRNVTLARNLARGFQPVELSAGEFNAALRALVAQTNRNRQISCRLEMPRAIRIADETLALNLYRVAQEAIANAVKHSGANQVILSFKRERNNLRLTVEDNGAGFSARKRSEGLGLHIMKYRASVLGGSLTVESKPKNGTRITCVVPLKASVRTTI